MKIIFATHHFPPHYHAGAEQYAYRVTKELTNRGHDVEVVCIESISKGGINPSVVNDLYDGIKVVRLSFDLSQYEDPLTASYRNESVGKWFLDYLGNNRPDIFHVNAGYLLSCKVLEVSHLLGIPTFLTLHDYWFMCPKITLLRTNGDICQEPVSESRCTWCHLSDQRRYRLWDNLTKNVAGEFISSLGNNPSFSNFLGFTSFNLKFADRRKYIKEVFKYVDVVISPSKFLLEKVEQYGLDTNSKVYMPFGYDKQQVADAQQTMPSDKLRIGYFGQISPHKGIHTLIKAFNSSRILQEQAELFIFGNLGHIEKYGESLGRLAKGNSAIKFEGSYDHDRISDIMNKIDVVVVPSEWFENRPTVIIEAFYYKKPVIASNLGGIPELVFHEKNGLLFKYGDEIDLANQLTRMVNEPTLLNTLTAGIEPVKTIDAEIDELEKLYQGRRGSFQK